MKFTLVLSGPPCKVTIVALCRDWICVDTTAIERENRQGTDQANDQRCLTLEIASDRRMIDPISPPDPV